MEVKEKKKEKKLVMFGTGKDRPCAVASKSTENPVKLYLSAKETKQKYGVNIWALVSYPGQNYRYKSIMEK